MSNLRVTNIDSFKRQLMRGLSQNINSRVSKISNKLEVFIGSKIKEWVLESPELNDFLFYGELGVPFEIWEQAMNDIGDLSEKSISVKSYKAPNIVGGILIEVFRGNFSDFLSLESGKYFTEKGVEIPWLKSLLLDGSKIIIDDYEFVELVDDQKDKSRTGTGIMIKTGGSWRIPPEYSGTVEDNFLTRAVLRHSEEIRSIINRELRNG